MNLDDHPKYDGGLWHPSSWSLLIVQSPVPYSSSLGSNECLKTKQLIDEISGATADSNRTGWAHTGHRTEGGGGDNNLRDPTSLEHWMLDEFLKCTSFITIHSRNWNKSNSFLTLCWKNNIERHLQLELVFVQNIVAIGWMGWLCALIGWFYQYTSNWSLIGGWLKGLTCWLLATAAVAQLTSDEEKINHCFIWKLITRIKNINFETMNHWWNRKSDL